jgi:PKD repeat protein
LIAFNAIKSNDPDGTITNYGWNFGDGTITDTPEPIITHSYASIGEYTVDLTVTDDDGATNTNTTTITVSNPPDLEITAKWLCWPDNCTICYNVTNIGTGTAPAGHNTALYVDGVAVAHDHVPVDLAPGESYTGCFGGYDWVYTPPSDNITVCADNNETLDELDETNNCLTNIWMCGDVRKDGFVTAWDVAVLNSYVAGIGELEVEGKWAGDVRTDGYITAWDVAVLNSKVAGIGDISCMCTQPDL